MNKIILAVFAAAMFAMPAKADMMDGQKGVGGQLGYAILGGDLKDVAKNGIVFGVHYYQALQNNFAIVPALDFYSFGKKTSGADITNTALTINGVYNFAEMSGLMPFAFVGLSYNSMKAASSTGDKTDSGLGYALGVGANKSINDKWIGGATLSYRIFPTFTSSGTDFSGNALVIGVHAGYKL